MRLALVGDIGGTNARFALWRDSRLESVRVLATADFATPELAVEYYLASLGLAPGSVGAACLACAGPVKGEQFIFTNNHWRLTRSDFCGALQLNELLLINDFAAMALGMTRVGEAGRRVICVGEAEPDAPALVIGPGTGLGVAALMPLGSGSWRALPGRAGTSTCPWRMRTRWRCGRCCLRSLAMCVPRMCSVVVACCCSTVRSAPWPV